MLPPAEARSVCDGLLLVGQVGCNNLVVSSDSMDVIDRMQNGGNSVEGGASIYEECSLVACNLASVKFFIVLGKAILWSICWLVKRRHPRVNCLT
jgi:hypothetical protein